MRYPLTFYVSGFPLRSWQAGAAAGPVILIRKGYEADEGLYQHELGHVEQSALFAFVGMILLPFLLAGFPQFTYWPILWGALAGLVVSGLAYKFIWRYRLYSEAQCYARQMRFKDRHGEFLTLSKAAARLMLPQYKLGLTVDQAEAEISHQREVASIWGPD